VNVTSVVLGVEVTLALYSPECVEVQFLELRLYGVLGSSLSSSAARGLLRVRYEAPEDSI
jgi:hypothetical protein